ncbi:type IX secretion system protein PorQ [Prevotella sp. oral taxon 299]|uniref:type IX secretion system protein PorQ n=1 Tax=Prevotella sp. oral taxon 299 TaxID=652716 RepID=UPI0001C3F289|nr:type IX secretion system protein PorQ [Prevotella sp. oral taxon 299]EFC70277.1 hypothetical protein HMPREF0669_01578 [Prevotella sp. oral taxon 299 str. F0039]
MSKYIITFFLIFQILNASAQESKTAYNFLRLPVSAHAAALGGENISLIEDDEALIFHNPALLSSVSNKTINVNYMNYMKGINSLSAAFNKTIKEKASVAFSAQYLNYGTLQQTDPSGNITGSFTAKDISVAGYFSYILAKDVAGGIAVKFITTNIGNYNSIAMGVDLGLNYYEPDYDWSVSIALKNLGGQLKAFDDEYETMPLDIQLGVTKRFTNTPFRASLTLFDLNHGNYKFIQHVNAGLDVILSDNIWVGAGYNFKRSNQMKLFTNDTSSAHGAGLSLGAGLILERFKLNLAYGKYHVSGSSLLINVGYSL